MRKTFIRRIATIAATVTLLTGAAACGSSTASAKPADLTGTWSETSGSKVKQTAVIKGNTITIDWKQDGDSALYWKGTYTKPSKPGDFTWTSKADTKTMKTALLASRDKTKKFSYKDGRIQYKVSALGSTVDVALERAKK